MLPKSPANPTRADVLMPIQTLALFLLVALAAGGLIWVFVFPILSGERHAEKRQANVVRSEPAARVAAAAGRGPKGRPEQIGGTLKGLAGRPKKAQNLPPPNATS